MVFPNYYYRYNAFYNKQKRENVGRSVASDSNTSIGHKITSESNNTAKHSIASESNNLEHNSLAKQEIKKRIPPRYNRVANFNFSNLFSSNLEEPILEIFGIRLYFDDILILGLLLFLYEEGVKDEMLFICLILLLLS